MYPTPLDGAEELRRRMAGFTGMAEGASSSALPSPAMARLEYLSYGSPLIVQVLMWRSRLWASNISFLGWSSSVVKTLLSQPPNILISCPSVGRISSDPIGLSPCSRRLLSIAGSASRRRSLLTLWCRGFTADFLASLNQTWIPLGESCL